MKFYAKVVPLEHISEATEHTTVGDIGTYKFNLKTYSRDSNGSENQNS